MCEEVVCKIVISVYACVAEVKIIDDWCYKNPCVLAEIGIIDEKC